MTAPAADDDATSAYKAVAATGNLGAHVPPRAKRKATRMAVVEARREKVSAIVAATPTAFFNKQRVADALGIHRDKLDADIRAINRGKTPEEVEGIVSHMLLALERCEKTCQDILTKPGSDKNALAAVRELRELLKDRLAMLSKLGIISTREPTPMFFAGRATAPAPERGDDASVEDDADFILAAVPNLTPEQQVALIEAYQRKSGSLAVIDVASSIDGGNAT